MLHFWNLEILINSHMTYMTYMNYMTSMTYIGRGVHDQPWLQSFRLHSTLTIKITKHKNWTYKEKVDVIENLEQLLNFILKNK